MYRWNLDVQNHRPRPGRDGEAEEGAALRLARGEVAHLGLGRGQDEAEVSRGDAVAAHHRGEQIVELGPAQRPLLGGQRARLGHIVEVRGHAPTVSLYLSTGCKLRLVADSAGC